MLGGTLLLSGSSVIRATALGGGGSRGGCLGVGGGSTLLTNASQLVECDAAEGPSYFATGGETLYQLPAPAGHWSAPPSPKLPGLHGSPPLPPPQSAPSTTLF